MQRFKCAIWACECSHLTMQMANKLLNAHLARGIMQDYTSRLPKMQHAISSFCYGPTVLWHFPGTALMHDNTTHLTALYLLQIYFTDLIWSGIGSGGEVRGADIFLKMESALNGRKIFPLPCPSSNSCGLSSVLHVFIQAVMHNDIRSVCPGQLCNI